MQFSSNKTVIATRDLLPAVCAVLLNDVYGLIDYAKAFGSTLDGLQSNAAMLYSSTFSKPSATIRSVLRQGYTVVRLCLGALLHWAERACV